MAKKVMSLSLPLEMQELLDVSADKMGWNRSELIRRLVEKYLNLLVHDDSEVPVVLRIPSDLKSNPDELSKWLHTRADGIVKALTNGQT
jgi:hypothetical protein